MKPLVLIFQTLLGCCLGAMSLAASAQMTPVGLWRNVDDETGQAKAEIRIQMEANGHLTGRVEKILVAAEDNVLCDACQDDRHGQRISGMEIIRGVRRAEHFGPRQWQNLQSATNPPGWGT